MFTVGDVLFPSIVPIFVGFSVIMARMENASHVYSWSVVMSCGTLKKPGLDGRSRFREGGLEALRLAQSHT